MTTVKEKMPFLFSPTIATRRKTYNLDDFVGLLSDAGARKMKRKVTTFRKKFHNDLARRTKVLSRQ